ncbi:MAG: NIPSNAP family protein [Spirosomataceae bacterium]
MKYRFWLIGLLSIVCLSFVAQQPSTMTPPDSRCFEMRIYFPHPGKMNDLLARFRNHTTKLFEKHGMTNIGYWVPQGKPDSVLIYVLAYPSREARDASWKNFGADPEWKKVQSESEANGKLVAKVETKFMKTTDFSQNDFSSVGNRVFELRTYKTTPYNLGLLLARFRNHTCKIFEKHEMTNLVYWTQDGTDDMLIYLLAHKSKEAGLASFKSFRDDPDWIAARTASEKLANGSLTISVQSEYLVPTDFSTWK